MNIPFVDLKLQYEEIQTEIENAIFKVIQSAKFIQGEDVNKFEEEFANYLGANYCIGVNSGTDALILGVRALELEQGDEILIPANTYISTALAASENGLRPVFVDINEDFQINLEDLKRKINNRTKAIIVVHMYGQPDSIEKIRESIKKTGKKIHFIEDASQAHGAEYQGKKVGTFGIFSAFSFYPGKNLGAYGDAGAIVTNSKELANKYKLLREYGQREKYYHDILGVNSRLDSIQAAVLRVKLKHLDKWNEKRIKISEYYSDLLKKYVPFIQTPKIFNGRKNVFHLYVIKTKKRDGLLEYLKENKIQSLIHYPIPLHLQRAYAYLGYKRGDLRVTEKISSEILSLPIYPELTREMQEFVVDRISKYFEGVKK